MVEIHEALRIAVDALKSNRALLSEHYRLTAGRAGEHWVFWFVFLPETPGQDVTVTVDDAGNTRITPGF